MNDIIEVKSNETINNDVWYRLYVNKNKIKKESEKAYLLVIEVNKELYSGWISKKLLKYTDKYYFTLHFNNKIF